MFFTFIQLFFFVYFCRASTIPKPTNHHSIMLYGTCFESNTVGNSRTYALINGKTLVFHSSQMNNHSNESSIYCLWFHKKYAASHPLSKNSKEIIKSIKKSSFVQTSNNTEKNTMISCKNNFFYVSHTSSIQSYHLCAPQCRLQECNQIFSEINMFPAPITQSSKNTSFFVEILVIGGLTFLIFFMIGLMYYLYYKFDRKLKQNATTNEHKSEAVIKEVLNEIAKYTIGETDEDAFYGDWRDSESMSSSSESGEEMGSKILQVVSNTKLPELNNSNVVVTSSSDEECSVLVSTNNTNKINKINEYIKPKQNEYYSKNITPKNESLLGLNIEATNQPKVLSDSVISLP